MSIKAVKSSTFQDESCLEQIHEDESLMFLNAVLIELRIRLGTDGGLGAVEPWIVDVSKRHRDYSRQLV